ncbi:MAG: TRAP transporter substrate-binding protein [Lachnospiraceae bacterium]|nr:TRAP transporter substrate-binding protein [Lachnospiraceae bacterium]
MKRKLVSLVLCLTMVGVMVGGCGSSSGSDTNTDPAPVEQEEEAAEPEAPSEGGEAAYVLSVATNTAEDSVNHELAAKFKELMEERSNGQVQIDLYENGQLGGDRELTEGVIAGSVDFCIGNTGTLVDFVPEVAIFDMANVYPDIETARAVFDGKILDELKPAYEKAGIKLFAYADDEYRIMTSNKKVETMDDFAGIKIRVMENSNHIAFWSALGANPTPMDFSELYMSLQQGTLDAQENPIDLVVANKLYEPQKYIINTNHMVHMLEMIGSKASYDALPAEIQELVDTCAVEAHQYARECADKREAEKEKVVEEYGCEIIDLSDEVLAQMGEAASSVYDQIRDQVGADLVDLLLSEVENAQKQ